MVGYVAAFYPTADYETPAYITSCTMLPLNHKITQEIEMVANHTVKFYDPNHDSTKRNSWS